MGGAPLIRIATRASRLALVQARSVADLLGGAELVEVGSTGPFGDKSRFVRGVEEALIDGRADLAVHSAKDLPGEDVEGLVIAGAAPREEPYDAWIGSGTSLQDAPKGAKVGTVSLRRRSQLLAARPDLRIEELHGNVDTRLRKLADGDLDAIVLASAGLRRLGLEAEIAFRLPAEAMVPAAGQGVLAIQVREADRDAAAAVAAISDSTALRDLEIERSVVAALGADCSSPVGVWARGEGGRIAVDAFVGLPDGTRRASARLDCEPAEPATIGAAVTSRLIDSGAEEILARASLENTDRLSNEWR